MFWKTIWKHQDVLSENPMEIFMSFSNSRDAIVSRHMYVVFSSRVSLLYVVHNVLYVQEAIKAFEFEFEL